MSGTVTCKDCKVVHRAYATARVIEFCELHAHAADYKGRVEVLESLLVCYRIGRQPSKVLLRRLDETRDALATEGLRKVGGHDG